MARAKGTGKTAAARAAEHKADLLAKGYKQKNLLLSPAALESLALVVAREGCTEADAVHRALAFRAGHPPPTMDNRQLLKLIGYRLRPDGTY